MTWLTAPAERGWLGERRERLLASITGTVLEIGGGTGANLPYYRNVERLILAEPDPFMRAKLCLRSRESGVPVDVIAVPPRRCHARLPASTSWYPRSCSARLRCRDLAR